MKKLVLVPALLVASFSVNAAVITSFSDNFDSEAVEYNASLDNWNVLVGTVDVVNNIGTTYPSTHAHACSSGNCVDLDGSSGHAGTIETKDSFATGQYTVSFDLSGNGNRWWSPEDTVEVSFGSYTQSFSLALDATWHTITASVTNAKNATLKFAHAGGDNAGILLDNVSVSAVPVPAAAFLFAPALAGFMGLRRKAKKAA